MIRFCLLSILLLFITEAQAQFNIQGQVIDEHDPLAYSTISIFTSTGEFVKGEISDEQGHFSINLDRGVYLVEVSYLGYRPLKKTIELTQDLNLDRIRLYVINNELDEIVVTAQKQLIERKADRLVFNLSNSIAAKGTDMSRAITMAPGILVQNGAISMVGRGDVRVLIDGRAVNLSGEELISFLSSISADDIEKVEIISNPPAKYEASGNAGLINIIYKKGRKNSWKNSTILSYEKNRRGFGLFRNSFSYDKNRTSLSISLNAEAGDTWEKEFGAVEFIRGPWAWESIGHSNQNGFSTRIAADHQLTNRVNFGAQYMGSQASPDFNRLTTNTIFNAVGGVDSLLINDALGFRERATHIMNLHTLLKLDTSGRDLSVDVDFFEYKNDLNLNYIINSFSGQNEFLGVHRARENNSTQRIINYSLKLDMVHPGAFIDLSYGARYSIIKTSNRLQDYDTRFNGRVLDTNLSNDFDHNEAITAAYLSGTKKINNRWQVKLGLRMEQTRTEGFSKTLNQNNKNNYIGFFPTAYINYAPNEMHNVSISVGSRVDRPGFRNLNPFRIYLTNKSYSEGNPFLQPSYTNTINLNYIYKGRYTTNAFVNRTVNGFGSIFTSEEDTELQAIVRDNFFNGVNMGIGELFTISSNKIWTSQNQIYLIYSHTNLTKGYDAEPRNGPQLYLSTNNTILLGKEWRFQVDLWYSSIHKNNLFRSGETYSLDLGFQKKFSNHLELSVQASDILNRASQRSLKSEINGIQNLYGRDYSSRNIRLTISYSFGNESINVSKRSFGSKEEQDRW